MPVQTSRAVRWGFVVFIAAVNLSCNLQKPAPPTLVPGSPSIVEEATETTEPLLQAPATIPFEPTASSPERQEIELRFTDPGTQEECVAHFPFEILSEGDQRTLSGEGVIDCRFEIQQCGEGVCVTYHSTYDMEGDLSGFVRENTPSYPDGAVEVYLAGTFTMTQYWTDIPPETVMAFTEANPFEVSSSDIIPLFFHFLDGATAEVGNTEAPDALPWVFTLHLR